MVVTGPCMPLGPASIGFRYEPERDRAFPDVGVSISTNSVAGSAAGGIDLHRQR